MRVAFMLALTAVLPAFGDTITIDTSSLIGDPNGPFVMDFQFTDGNGIGDGNNTVTLSNFSDPRSLTLVPGSVTGGVTVNSGPFSFSMTDTSFFNEVQFTLNPDAILSFDLPLTQHPGRNRLSLDRSQIAIMLLFQSLRVLFQGFQDHPRSPC
jgi:hypothetical protein